MIFGITGNTAKDDLWPLLGDLITWMNAEEILFQLHTPIADGLVKRSLIPSEVAHKISTHTPAQSSSMILSIGGDGTLLHTAYEVGVSGIPILGINIGYLGFLATVESTRIQDAFQLLLTNQYKIEERSALSVSGSRTGWALNDVVITRQPTGGLAAIDVFVDRTRLNRYWGDGLIIATPTGSTAYSLAVGGPIVMPESDVFIVSPVAPHSLTVRPIVLSASSTLTVQLASSSSDCTVALDGRTFPISNKEDPFTICRADHSIRLVRLNDSDYLEHFVLSFLGEWGLK